MSASLKVDTRQLKKLAASLDDPKVKETLRTFPMRKSVVALVAQAIADNFQQEGPGWAPLKASTIRYSLSKRLRKSIGWMDDEQILEHERDARKKDSDLTPYRQILRRTNLLYKTVTTPGFHGSNKQGASGGNIWKQEGTNLVYGTDLSYATKQNKGDPKHKIPARPFLVLRQEWRSRLLDHLGRTVFNTIKQSIQGALR